MGDSNAEEIERLSDNSSADECEKDERQKYQETVVDCAQKSGTPIASPVKRKSEIKIETKRRRSTDRVPKYCDDENLTQSSNAQNIAPNDNRSENLSELSERNSKFADQVNEEAFKGQCIITSKTDQSATKENVVETTHKTRATPHLIQTNSVTKNVSPSDEHDRSESDLSETLPLDKINFDAASDSRDIVNNSKIEEARKIFENLEADEKKCFKMQETGKPCRQYEMHAPHEALVKSPVKKDCKSKAGHDLNLKQNIDTTGKESEDKTFTDNLNVHDAASMVDHSKQRKGVLVKFSENKVRSVKKQVRFLLDTDNESTVKEKNKTKDETDSTYQSRSHNFLEMEGLAARMMLNIDKISTSQKHNTSNKFSQRQQLHFPHKPENKLEKSPDKAIHRHLELPRDSSLKSNQRSNEACISESRNIGKSHEHAQTDKALPQQQNFLPPAVQRQSRTIRIPGVSPDNSTPEFKLHPIYIEPESKFIPVEHYARDPEFVESQKQILASLKQSAGNKLRHSEPNVSENNTNIEETDSRSAEDICKENIILKAVIEFIRIHGDRLGNIPKELYSKLRELAANCENIPYLTINYPEYAKQLAAANITTDDTSDEEISEQDKTITPFEVRDSPRSPDMSPPDENRRSLNLLPPVVNPELPDMLSPIGDPEYPNLLPPDLNKVKNKIPEADYPRFREYPGLAEEPTKVKKDARYQKKFYRQKPVKLPINWKMNRPLNESDPNEGSKAQGSGDDPQIIAESNNPNERNRNVANVDPPILSKEEDNVDPPILSKEEDNVANVDSPILLKEEDNKHDEENRKIGPPLSNDNERCEADRTESHKDNLTETAACVDGYKLSSFMEESPTSPAGSCKSESEDEKSNDSPLSTPKKISN